MSIGIALAVGVAGYLIGSISFARLVGRFVAPEADLGTEELYWTEDKGFEVENVSATSIEQRKGPALGCLTGSFDILKATIPVLALHLAYPDLSYDVVYATTVVAGHNLPLYHSFKGGRGTATMLGGLLVLAPLSIPITIFLGYLIGLYVFKDVLLAHHAGWILLLPVYFAVLGDWDLALYGLAVNVLRWSVSVPELKQWWGYRRSGELQTREFHDAIEQTHIGYIHGKLRARGWLRYPYMRQDGT